MCHCVCCRFEKFEIDGKKRHAFAGFVSTYEFYCYPDNIRPRVSQMLIIPPFQGTGLGAKLLNEVFLYYRTESKVTDVSGKLSFIRVYLWFLIALKSNSRESIC